MAGLPRRSGARRHDVLFSLLSQPLFHSVSMPIHPLAETPSELVANRPGAVSDVFNLFTHFGAASAAVAYQEIHSDVAADAAARRWPLVAEWLSGISHTPGQSD